MGVEGLEGGQQDGPLRCCQLTLGLPASPPVADGVAVRVVVVVVVKAALCTGVQLAEELCRGKRQHQQTQQFLCVSMPVEFLCSSMPVELWLREASQEGFESAHIQSSIKVLGTRKTSERYQKGLTGEGSCSRARWKL